MEPPTNTENYQLVSRGGNEFFIYIFFLYFCRVSTYLKELSKILHDSLSESSIQLNIPLLFDYN